jgi:hypothetical protein
MQMPADWGTRRSGRSEEVAGAASPVIYSVIRAVVLAAVLATAVVLTGCGDSGTAPTALLTGVFTLQTVNRAPLPAVTSRDARGTVEVLANSIQFFANATYAEFGQIRARTVLG